MHRMCDAGGAIFFSTHVLEVAQKLHHADSFQYAFGIFCPKRVQRKNLNQINFHADPEPGFYSGEIIGVVSV